jgi:hypothetical protein
LFSSIKNCCKSCVSGILSARAILFVPLEQLICLRGNSKRAPTIPAVTTHPPDQNSQRGPVNRLMAPLCLFGLWADALCIILTGLPAREMRLVTAPTSRNFGPHDQWSKVGRTAGQTGMLFILLPGFLSIRFPCF